MRSRSNEEKAQIARELYQQVWDIVQSGKIKPIINKIYTLNQVESAHQYMESGDLIGKIILINR